jgi:hypothetical protein
MHSFQILKIFMAQIRCPTLLQAGVGIAQWYSAGLRAGFVSRQGLGNFLFTTASRPALGHTQPPIQWVSEVLSLGVKRPGREADHSPPSNAEVKEWVELYFHSPIRLHGVVPS